MHIAVWPTLQETKNTVDVLKSLATIVGVLIAGLWAWSRFVLERGIIPPSQLDLSLRTISRLQDALVLEAEVRIENKGSSNLIIDDLRLRLRHTRRGEPLRVETDMRNPAYGRLAFPHAGVYRLATVPKRSRGSKGKDPVLLTDVSQEVLKEYNEKDVLGTGEFLILPYKTFVQPDVTQLYTFITALPADAEHVLARASFRYEIKPKWLQLKVLRLSRSLGLLQYSLDHVKEPHTVERVVLVSGDDPNE